MVHEYEFNSGSQGQEFWGYASACVCGGYSFDQLGEDLKLLKISGGGGNPEGEWSICSLVTLEVV